MVRGTESYGEATWGRHQALDEVTSRRFGGALINCMGMAPEDYWHRLHRQSPVVATTIYRTILIRWANTLSRTHTVHC